MSDPIVIEPSTSSSSTARDPNPNPNSNPTPNPVSLLRPRREPFEHGLLPIPKLVFTDPTQTLIPLKQTLLSSSSNLRVDSASLSEGLQISQDHARLVIDTLASVLHSDSDPLVGSKPAEIDSASANIHDLVLFLYIQSYKKLLPRTHKDSASVADVWPSTSAFDGYLSALSPLQVGSVPISIFFQILHSNVVNRETASLAIANWFSLISLSFELTISVSFFSHIFLKCGIMFWLILSK